MKNKNKEPSVETIRVVSTRDPIYDPYQKVWIEPTKSAVVQRTDFVRRHLDAKALKVI